MLNYYKFCNGSPYTVLVKFAVLCHDCHIAFLAPMYDYYRVQRPAVAGEMCAGCRFIARLEVGQTNGCRHETAGARQLALFAEPREA